MNKTFSKSLLIAVFLFVLIVFQQNCYADAYWNLKPPTNPYGDGRVYTREHWTRFWVNPNGYDLGTTGADSIGSMWCSVFDLATNNFSNGYTAVTDLDQNDYGRFQGIQTLFLNPYGIAKSSVQGAENDYIVSPAYYKSGSGSSPFSQASGCRYDVTVEKSQAGSYFSDQTPQNSVCLNNTAPSFRAGGYDGQVRSSYEWYSYDNKSNPQYGEINLTPDSAYGFYTSIPSGSTKTTSTSADVVVSFPYGLTVATLNRMNNVTQVGDTEKWQALIYNTTPYTAKQVNLRAYRLEQGDTIRLIDSQVVDINPTPLTGGGMGSCFYNFSVPLGDKSYKIIVTANMAIKDNSTAVNSSTVYTEPLKSNFAYGSSAGQSTPYNGYPEKASWMVPSGHSGLAGYDDNWLDSSQLTGASTQTNQASDLVADSVTYDTSSKYATATFHTTFTRSGNANVRFYEQYSDGRISQFGQTQSVFIDAAGTRSVTAKSSQYTVSTGSTVLATIDYYYDSFSYSWKSEQFHASDGSYLNETSYSNNTATCIVSLIPAPPPPPPPPPAGSQDQYKSVTYYPLVATPWYKTIQQTIFEDNWTEIPYNVQQPQAKIRSYIIK